MSEEGIVRGQGNLLKFLNMMVDPEKTSLRGLRYGGKLGRAEAQKVRGTCTGSPGVSDWKCSFGVSTIFHRWKHWL